MEDNDLELGKKLSNLEKKVSDRTVSTLFDVKVTFSSLQDLGPSEVLVRHSFDLTDKHPIYHARTRMALRQMRLLEESWTWW